MDSEQYVPLNFTYYHKDSPVFSGSFMIKHINELPNIPFPMSNKTIYTNPIMKQVAELCDNGHYPICKNKNGDFAIFTPFKRVSCYKEKELVVRSNWEETIEGCKKTIGCTYQSEFNDFDPIKIVGFYHHPIPEFKVGDKVKKLVTGIQRELPIGEIESFNVVNGTYRVFFPGRDYSNIAPHLLEPYLESAQKVQTINIGGKEYPITPELEKALKNLKPINEK